MNVSVYTRPDCTACYHTKRWLESHHVEYTEIELTDADTDLLAAKGYTSLPVVITETGQAWEGFRIDKLRTLGSR